MYFSNCKNWPHVRLFGAGAFYDLNVTSIQASQAVGLQVGEECVFATTAPDSRVAFTWYSFLPERRLRESGSADRTGYQVFFGDPLCWPRRSRRRLPRPTRAIGPSPTSAEREGGRFAAQARPHYLIGVPRHAGPDP